MNRREALHGAGAFTGPAALVIGGSMLTLTLTHAGSFQPEAAPPRPRPTVTATAPPASSAPAKPVRSHTSTPRSTPRTEPTGGRVVAASAPRSSGSSTARRPGSGAPSGPTPSPPAAQQPAAQCNVALAVAALNACLKLGGTR